MRHSPHAGSLCAAHTKLIFFCRFFTVPRFIEVKTDYENSRMTLLSLSRNPSAKDDDCVPASAALSFRIAANALKYALTQRSGRSSPGNQRRAGGGGTGRSQLSQASQASDGSLAEPVEVLDQGDDPTDEELFSAMQGQWVEVECLLRVQLRTPEALEEGRKRVSESLAFDNALGQKAAAVGVLKGTIFQALLARADGSAEATAASVGVEMAEAEWEAQAAGADALRKLVRIKVQDDNDLKAANGALSSCAEFFANLSTYASRNSLKETEVLEKLEEPVQ